MMLVFLQPKPYAHMKKSLKSSTKFYLKTATGLFVTLQRNFGQKLTYSFYAHLKEVKLT